MKKTGVELIAEKRAKQIAKHGSTINHDAVMHGNGELLKAALFAATNGEGVAYCQPGFEDFEEGVEIDAHEPLDNLIKAGALIAAEIDRLIAVEYYK